MTFFNRLQSDMQRLGVVNDDRHPETYRQLVQLADKASGKDNYDTEAVKSIDPQSLQTIFARNALNLFHNDPLLSDTDASLRNNKIYGICDMAEYRIATALNPENCTNPTIASPIVITLESDPVGILQRSRNARRMIYYALRDEAISHTSQGCVYQLPIPFTAFTELLKSDNAWTMPVEQLGDSAENGRLSVFTIPTFERQKLAVDDPIEEPALQRSHQSLAAWARVTLDDAEPISLK